MSTFEHFDTEIRMFGRFGLTKISTGDFMDKLVFIAFTVDLSAVPVRDKIGVPKTANDHRFTHTEGFSTKQVESSGIIQSKRVK
jgi:hypothetical protein